MNKVILMGRLTREPDSRYTAGENSMAIARYTLAVDRRKAAADGQRDADFISCVAFGRQAEFAAKYLHQGSKIALTGRIQTGSYQNKDGQKVYTTDVIVEDQEFAESRAESESRRNAQARTPAPSYASSPTQGYASSPTQGYASSPAQGYASAPAAQGYASAPAAGYASQEPAASSASQETESAEAEPAPDYSQAEGEGFMNIPEGVEDEGLPFNFS